MNLIKNNHGEKEELIIMSNLNNPGVNVNSSGSSSSSRICRIPLADLLASDYPYLKDVKRGLELNQISGLRARFGYNDLEDDDDDDDDDDGNEADDDEDSKARKINNSNHRTSWLPSSWWPWNFLPKRRRKFLVEMMENLGEQVKNPLILLLFGSAGVSFLVGQYDNAFSIFMAIVIVVTVAFVQEYQSEKSLEALNKLVPHHCKVLRGGHFIGGGGSGGGPSSPITSHNNHINNNRILARELVPGDIVSFDLGDRIPADLRLIQSVDLEVDESMLTGENRPCKKQSSFLPINNNQSGGEIPLAERSNMVFMGTLVRQGNGTGIVTSTGRRTEFGAVFSLMRSTEESKTPLQARMDELGKQLSIFSFIIIGILSVVGLLQGRPLMQVFTIAVSLAVAAIPEGLPIVVTVTLAIGVYRLARKSVIVKKLTSVESLSSVDVICLDKTGTLTLNELTVTQIYLPKSSKLIDPTIINNNEKLEGLEALLLTSNLCNNARWMEDSFVGNAVDCALMNLVKSIKGKGKASYAFEDERNNFDRLEDIPFNSEIKFMATQCKRKSNSKRGSSSDQPSTLYHVKGAPEYILARCKNFISSVDDVGSSVEIMTELDREEFLSQAKSMASNLGGLRILALACGEGLFDKSGQSDGLSFLGLLAMHDPPRPNIGRTISTFKDLGIRVLMITGDSAETATCIAKQVNILPEGEKLLSEHVMSGDDLDQLTHEKKSDLHSNSFHYRLDSLRVLYRATPLHKVKIVQWLKDHGHVVAMSGDGVNDGPSLKLADVGISMGQGGTDVSREAANIILVDDNLEHLVSAIYEGKAIFKNIRGFIRFQLSTSLAALGLVAIASALGLDNPLNAMQILWINIIMDGPPAQSLGLEPCNNETRMLTGSEPLLTTNSNHSDGPRPKSAPIITRDLLEKVVLSALVIMTGTFGIYYFERNESTRRDTTMTFTAFVFFDMFNALASRFEERSLFFTNNNVNGNNGNGWVFTPGQVFSNPYLNWAIFLSLLGQFMVIYVPFLQSIFQTESLTLSDLLLLVGISSLVLVVEEIRKLILVPLFNSSSNSNGNMGGVNNNNNVGGAGGSSGFTVSAAAFNPIRRKWWFSSLARRLKLDLLAASVISLIPGSSSAHNANEETVKGHKKRFKKINPFVFNNGSNNLNGNRSSSSGSVSSLLLYNNNNNNNSANNNVKVNEDGNDYFDDFYYQNENEAELA